MRYMRDFRLADIRPVDWLRYYGVLIWVLVCIPLALLPVLTEGTFGTGAIVGWWSSAILFLLALLHPTLRLQMRSPLWRRVAVLLVMSLAVISISYFTRSGIGVLLAMVVAAMLPWLLPAIFGVAWVIVLAMGFGVWVIFMPEGTWLLALVFVIMNLGLVLLPFIASLLALKQMQARGELRRVNSELLATQSLLTENTRIAERVRISRELHDLVGHHLTALSLNLEVASHLTEGKSHEHVNQAASIARLLLSDVREVVSEMREDDQVDLRAALEMLATGVPELTVHLDIPEHLSLTDPRRAQILLRCAQEVITNTVRHASASNLWITLESGSDGTSLQARDDGQGVVDLLPGNGLKGMRERLSELGGRLEIVTRPGAGFQVRAWMPGEGTT